MGRLSDLFQQSTTAKPQDDKRGRLATALNANIATQNDELGSDLITAIPKAAQKTYDNPAINAAIGFTPVLGDIQAGYEAQKEARAGNYGTAALNAVGMLPFVPALGGLVAAQKIMGRAGGSAENLPALAKALPDQQGMIAWHGSPHKFDKFDMSKIGTGEGAQAYGHGLYFAENPDVAKAYETAGIRSTPIQYQGKSISDISREEWPSIPDITRKALIWLKDESKITDAAKNARNSGVPGLAEEVERLSGAGRINELPQGSFYKTDIPDEAVARFLDWDKPLSEEMRQPVSKAMLDKFGSGLSMGSGEQAYKQILDEFKFAGSKDPKNDAIAWMNQQGIPGIRYLDGGSRGTGTGSSNFVLFDDQLPRILEVNGKPTGNQPWAPGEWESNLAKALGAAR